MYYDTFIRTTAWALRTALEMLIRHLEHPQHPDQDLDDRPLFMVV